MKTEEDREKLERMFKQEIRELEEAAVEGLMQELKEERAISAFRLVMIEKLEAERNDLSDRLARAQGVIREWQQVLGFDGWKWEDGSGTNKN